MKEFSIVYIMLVLGSHAKPGIGFLLNSTLFSFCVFKFVKKKKKKKILSATKEPQFWSKQIKINCPQRVVKNRK